MLKRVRDENRFLRTAPRVCVAAVVGIRFTTPRTFVALGFPSTTPYHAARTRAAREVRQQWAILPTAHHRKLVHRLLDDRIVGTANFGPCSKLALRFGNLLQCGRHKVMPEPHIDS